MNRVSFFVVIALLLASTQVEGKTLRPKFYKKCYVDYKAMRKVVPKPPIDIGETANKVSTVANIAGSLGGFGGLGGFGSAASKASKIAAYSSTIVDILEFTEAMQQNFPQAPDRYKAYGDRMNNEAVDIEKAADFAMKSQDCYAAAYASLRKKSATLKPKEVRKRHNEIKVGTENVGELLSDATIYMKTNIQAYNEALTTDTTTNGLDLANLLAMAQQASVISTKVDALSGSGNGWMGGGWTPTEVRVEAHRQAMAAHYGAAGLASPYEAPVVDDGALFSNLSTLTNIVNLSEVDPGMALQLALEQGVGAASMTGDDATPMNPAAATGGDRSTAENIDALRAAGGEIEPYLEAYNRVETLSIMQQGVSGFVNQTI